MKLKICGMRDAANICEVAKLSPDFMGFIFYHGSKRFVGDDFAMPDLPPQIKKVGVFVNNNVHDIQEKTEKYKLDFIQLHGDESAHYCTELFQELKLANKHVQLVKAFGIDDQFDFSVLKEYEHSCDYFLFDTKTNDFGGSGTSFDKTVLKNYKLSKFFFISGGIGIEEVSKLPYDIRLLAIDVNSKFEIKPGLKDINKLKILKNELSGK